MRISYRSIFAEIKKIVYQDSATLRLRIRKLLLRNRQSIGHNNLAIVRLGLSDIVGLIRS